MPEILGLVLVPCPDGDSSSEPMMAISRSGALTAISLTIEGYKAEAKCAHHELESEGNRIGRTY